MITTAFLVMQFIISAKAGLVNAVEGTTNVHVQEMVPAGTPIQTGPSSRVEILLNPGTFLRLGEGTQAVLDSVDLTNVQVRILSGSAVIECGSVEKNSPIRVTNGTEMLLISKPGTYRFPEYAVSASLDDWNQQRSELIDSANARSAATDAASNNPAYPSQDLPGYPGAIWPNGVYPSAGSSLSYYPSYYPSFYPSYLGGFGGYGGYGYSFYQPLGPLVFYPGFVSRPFQRPLPVVTTLRPVTTVTRPPVPVTRPVATPRPAPAPSRIGARTIAGGRR